MNVLLNKCDCDWGHLSRIPRTWWMRLFRSRRLYFCSGCKSHVFAHRGTIEGSPQWWESGEMLFMAETLPTLGNS